MQKKFQVFVSSTYEDLIEERQDALKSILDLGHIPSGMEGFFAADQEQLSYIKKIIDECDYYVLIIGGRYGSTDEGGVSYTEREYDYAVSKGITVLAFIRNDVISLPVSKVDSDPTKLDNLRRFREKVSKKRLISYWSSREQLKAAIIISLSKAIGDAPSIGWVRGDAPAAEDILSQLNDARNELEKLRSENTLLREAISPKLDNLATLDTPFTIRYRYQRDNYRGSDSAELTWAEIFRAVGPSYFSPGPERTIGISLAGYIRVKRGLSRDRAYSIEHVDVETVKLQLLGHGLIHVSQARSVGGSVHEYIALTDFGKRVLLEIGTVRMQSETAGTP